MVIYAAAATTGEAVVYNHPGATAHPFNGDNHAARGYGQSRGQSGMHSGAFSGYDHGGQSRSFSSRGSDSFERLTTAEADRTVAAAMRRRWRPRSPLVRQEFRAVPKVSGRNRLPVRALLTICGRTKVNVIPLAPDAGRDREERTLSSVFVGAQL